MADSALFVLTTAVLAPIGVYIMARLIFAAYFKSRNQFGRKDS